MFLVECLPLSKGLNKDSLSYFSGEFIEVGSILKVNIRNKSTYALITKIENVIDVKTEIKSANFKFKKISPKEIRSARKDFFDPNFLEAVKKTSKYFVCSEGGTIYRLVPQLIMENPNLVFQSKENKTKKEGIEKNTKSQIFALQGDDEERYIAYKSIIREEFAKNKSVFLCVPQNENVRKAKIKIEKGIESFVFSFHKEMSKKNLKEEWRKAMTEPHPVVIIGTGRWLFNTRKDLGTIIIENENDIGWKNISKPFIDIRFFLEILAKEKHINIVFGDILLRIETLYRCRQGEINEYEPIKWRTGGMEENEIVDMREASKKEFKILSKEIENLIEETRNSGKKMFIFSSRKGLSPIILCRDCGEYVHCNNCDSPMVLYKSKGVGVFRCHQCGEVRDAREVCRKCKSWKLEGFGIGIDLVHQEIKKKFGELNIFEIYKEKNKTSTKTRDVIKDFYETKGSILIGTEMALPYLHKKIENTAIASFDSLFSIPDFRAKEKILRLILQTKNISKEKFILQSRNSEDEIIKIIKEGNLQEFYNQEIRDRKQLNYPPFGIFIKITTRGNQNFILKESEKLKNILKKYSPIIFNSVHEKKGEQKAINLIIKLPKENWPEPTLLSILKSLPFHFETKIDPDNLL